MLGKQRRKRRPYSGTGIPNIKPAGCFKMIALEAKRRNRRILIVPIHNAAEAAVVKGVNVFKLFAI